ncbi:hypothetical protein CQW23_21808 [Capsicum baccatum]|uniref:Bet v I/Major latex protein domain-containing protein n=1 Tax=Capsicum baccatum TaxID=33114 RepID=A0A2G2VZ32_CAPBA|nr:hypothetical protein CQW23_21808 [Capsicum baccatum]
MSFVCYFGGAVVGGGFGVGTCGVCVVDGVETYGVISLLLMLIKGSEIGSNFAQPALKARVKMGSRNKLLANRITSYVGRFEPIRLRNQVKGSGNNKAWDFYPTSDLLVSTAIGLIIATNRSHGMQVRLQKLTPWLPLFLLLQLLVQDISILHDTVRELQGQVNDLQRELVAMRVTMFREIQRLIGALLLVLSIDEPCVGIDWSSIGFMSTDYQSVVTDLSSIGGKYSSLMELCCVLPANVHLLPQMDESSVVTGESYVATDYISVAIDKALVGIDVMVTRLLESSSGSVTSEGKEEVVKVVIEDVDEEKRLVTFKAFEGYIIEQYDAFKMTLHIEKGEKNLGLMGSRIREKE